MSESNGGDRPPEKIIEKIEQDLSPEIMEKIMEKLQDIDAPGVAYTTLIAINREKGKNARANFLDYLRFGVLGGENIHSEPGEERKNKWAEGLKTYNIKTEGGTTIWCGDKKETEEYKRQLEQKGESVKIMTRPEYRKKVIHFNVVGRAKQRAEGKYNPKKTQISQTDYASRPSRVTMLFDLSPYAEQNPMSIQTFRAGGTDMNLRTFKPMFNDLYGAPRDSQKKMLPDLQYGFVLALRIPPKFFRGIVVNGPPLQDDPDKADVNPQKLETRAIEVAKIMREAYQDDPEKLLPIYDMDGNLLWPQQMNYAEVKRRIAEKSKTDKKP